MNSKKTVDDMIADADMIENSAQPNNDDENDVHEKEIIHSEALSSIEKKLNTLSRKKSL